MFERFERVAGGLVLGGAVLLFADLFLDWRKLTVDLPALQLNTGSSGWAGWGVVAGVLLVALLAWESARWAGYRSADPDAIPAIMSLGVLAFVIVRFFEDATNVSVGGVVNIGEASRQWPAYAGLVLAVVVAAAACVRLLPHARSHGHALPGPA